MDAGAKSLRFLGEGKKLSVPFFQRRYVWEESNWLELLEAFENSEVMPFLGSIIIKGESPKNSVIIDGQQRLTTVTILAKAIYDSLSDSSKQSGSGIRNCVENFLFYRDNAADDFADSHVRIEHSRLDQADYNRVIESQMLNNVSEIDLDTVNENSGNVLKCYKYYRNKLYGKGDSNLKTLFNAIFDEDRKVFVLIELEQGDINEQTIFDTINRAGIRLSTADIIKNNLFKRMLETGGSTPSQKDHVVTIYQNCWENVFNDNQRESELWDAERIFGNVKHNNLEFLLYCIACIKWGEDCDMFSKLENVFDREMAQMSFGELQLLAQEIKEYAIIFKKYILDFKDELEDEEKSAYFKYEDSVQRLLLILQKFGVQMFYPYVIMRLKDVNQNENDSVLKKDFGILESFIMRRKISPKGTHDYTSKCYSMIKSGSTALIQSDLANGDAGITDIDVKTYLNSTKDDSAKMILFWIELYRRKDPGFDINALEYKYTLEHIMPKKWEANWSSVQISSNGVDYDVNSDDGKAIRNSAIQSIGNKTLLTHSLNATVKNSDYYHKVNGISPSKPGYKTHTTLLLTKELVDRFDSDSKWDELHIANRSVELYNEFLKLWPSYSSELPPMPTQDEDEATPVQYTAEQLSDALKLLEAMDIADSVDSTDGMISVAELIRMVDVQAETIESYIREGKLNPDLVVPTSEHRSIKCFRAESVPSIAEQFGWTIITNDNRKDVFMSMVSRMDMSYSYKPILLKAIFEKNPLVREMQLSNIVKYFLDFFKKRISDGLIPEKEKSVFSNVDCTYKAAENVILTYPVKRFSDIGVIDYCETTGMIAFDENVWSKLTEDEINTILSTCDSKLDSYFDNLLSSSMS